MTKIEVTQVLGKKYRCTNYRITADSPGFRTFPPSNVSKCQSHQRPFQFGGCTFVGKGLIIVQQSRKGG